uniref:CASP-like protein n=1 Tax=Anthurium amnicola TaxID=1678845 RepID=A0A1D1Z0V4_9ARAE
MKSFPGTPGTFSSLVFRIMQSLFAAGSVASMASAPGFSAYTAFCYLIVSMALQFIWSMGLACLDIYQLVKKSDLHHSILVGLFVAGDWVTGMLSLAAVSASAGLTILFDRDLGYCKMGECWNFQLAVSLGFASWLMVWLSSLVMLWLLAAG